MSLGRTHLVGVQVQEGEKIKAWLCKGLDRDAEHVAHKTLAQAADVEGLLQ